MRDYLADPGSEQLLDIEFKEDDHGNTRINAIRFIIQVSSKYDMHCLVPLDSWPDNVIGRSLQGYMANCHFSDSLLPLRP